jgi:hypothetical protein
MKYGKIFVTTIVLFVFLMSGITFMTAASIPTEPTAHSTRDMGAFTRDMGGGDAYDSYGASDSATTLSTPASGTGTLTYSSDQYDQYKVAVSSGDEVTIDFTAPSGSTGLDVPIYDTDKSQILIRYNVGTISETVTASGNGYIYFTLDADRSSDTGTYSLAVSVNGGGGGEDDGGELTDGVTANGNMDSADGADMWYIDVGANAESMYVVLECGSSDFDTYGKFGSEPTTSNYDWRGYTGGGEENTISNPQEGRHYIMVDWYSGSGAYTLTATITYGSSDTTPPTVSITNPANGATVSGTVTITATASDNVGVTDVQCRIDSGSWTSDSTSPYSWSWDTTQETDGSHTITCRAYDAAGNYADDSVTVTVSNGGGGDDGGELTDGVGATGHMDQADGSDMYWIDVGANAQSMRVVLTQSSGDFDTYGKFGSEPTTSNYDWRGYTSGGEDNTISNPQEGRHYIMVDWYSGDDDYTLTVTITYGGGGGWGTGGKYAILVGISDYQYISDLSYCDEDATDWYWQLDGLGYECHVYGDGHTGDYPRYDGDATEATVRADMQDLAAHAQSGDEVCFITSGHGSGDGAGSSYLCMYECSGSQGCYYDTELASDVGQFASGVNIFVFIDHCYSGGMGPELMALSISQYIYCATTCTEDGYGWDDSTHQNGMWTYYFLDYSWQTNYGGDAGDSMEKVFTYAHDNYPKSGGDEPQEFDGNTGSSFYL